MAALTQPVDDVVMLISSTARQRVTTVMAVMCTECGSENNSRECEHGCVEHGTSASCHGCSSGSCSTGEVCDTTRTVHRCVNELDSE